MIKKLLGLLVILLLLVGCGGEGIDGLHDDLYLHGGGISKDRTFVEVQAECDYTRKYTTLIKVSCEQLDELDYANNPPAKCEEITFTDIDGNSVTSLYVRYQKGTDCD